MKKLSSEQVRKEFAMQARHLPGHREVKEVTVVATTKKPSFIKRAVMFASLAIGISTGAVLVVDAAMPEYGGAVQAKICWDCNEQGAYKTPKAAIKAVNPNATDKEVAKAEEEFKYMNNLPADLEYSYTLKVGEYDIPVIK